MPIVPEGWGWQYDWHQRSGQWVPDGWMFQPDFSFLKRTRWGRKKYQFDFEPVEIPEKSEKHSWNTANYELSMDIAPYHPKKEVLNNGNTVILSHNAALAQHISKISGLLRSYRREAEESSYFA